MAKSSFWWVPFGGVPEISAEELHGQLSRAQPPQVLDVRTGLEWKTSRIPGARSAPITSLKSQLESLGLDPARPVVAICLSAHRSIPAVRLLQDAGFEQVCQLQGGMRAWWKASLPVEKGE